MSTLKICELQGVSREAFVLRGVRGQRLDRASPLQTRVCRGSPRHARACSRGTCVCRGSPRRVGARAPAARASAEEPRGCRGAPRHARAPTCHGGSCAPRGAARAAPEETRVCRGAPLHARARRRAPMCARVLPCAARLQRRRAAAEEPRDTRGGARAPTCRASAEETRGSRGDARRAAQGRSGVPRDALHGRLPALTGDPKVRMASVRTPVGHQKCKSTCTYYWGGGLYLYSAMRQPPRIIAAPALPRPHRRARIVIVVVIVVVIVIVSITMI